MKWLVIQSDGQHKGQPGDPWEPNWMMRECYAIKAALIAFGDDADIWGKGHDNFHAPPDIHGYDGIFTIENYDFGWLPRVNGCYRALRLFWVIDAHWQPLTAYADALQGYDIVLHSTRGFIKPYQQLYPGRKHIYFPNGVDNRFFDRALYPERLRTRDVIFIGGKAAPRAAAIDYMVQHGMDYHYGITGMDYVGAVLRARIQFNKGLNGDINYRNWETLGLGTCLLTEHDAEMELLGFKHDVNCLFYRSVEEAAELAKTYTANGEWRRIAENGYLLAQEHSYTKRIERLIHNLFTNETCLQTLWNTPTPKSANTSPTLLTR